MNIQVSRMVARNCWKLAGNFQELSPAARRVLGVMGGDNYEPPKNLFVCCLHGVMKKILHWRMDKLILMKDSSVRVMVLKAMKIAGYTSKHVGLISTLYASDEVGYTLNEKGENMSSEEISHEVWCYFLDILDVPNYLDDLRQKTDHWEGCLRIDYTKEFSVEGMWDRSGDKPRYIQRNVPPEEVEARIARNKADVKELYRYDLEKLLEKKLSGYYERRELEVHQCLQAIFLYIVNNKLDDKLIGSVLEMLAHIARCGHFPEKWLLELSQKHTIS